MITVQTLTFEIVAVLYLLNLSQLTSLVFGKQRQNKIHILFSIPYFISCVLMSLFSDGNHPLIYFCATMCFYISLYISVAARNKCKLASIAYITILFLSIDSIMQSLGCIIIKLCENNFNQFLVWKTSSIIFNLIVFLLVKRLIKNHKNQVRNSITLLSKMISASSCPMRWIMPSKPAQDSLPMNRKSLQ